MTHHLSEEASEALIQACQDGDADEWVGGYVDDQLAEANAEIERLRGVLNYIASPTMGYQPGPDSKPGDHAMTGPERLIRGALGTCINMANQALGREDMISHLVRYDITIGEGS